MKNDICNKNYAEFVDILRYKDKNPDQREKNKFTTQEIQRLWDLQENAYCYFVALMEQIGMNHHPHETRHSCILLLVRRMLTRPLSRKLYGTQLQ